DVKGQADGINASATAGGSVTVSGSGNTVATTGQGIIAKSNTGAVLVNRTGKVDSFGNGINASSTGGGAVTVQGVGTIPATAAASTGIIAKATGGNGNVLVQPGSTVTGGAGITASAVGTGTIQVIADFQVKGTSTTGVRTTAEGGNTLVTGAG